MSLPYASVVAGFDFDDDGQKKTLAEFACKGHHLWF